MMMPALAPNALQAHLPRWAEPLKRPARYKVLHGGRGSGKTWTVAMLLALRAAQEPIRVACVREHQKSLIESAKLTIEQSIVRMGLSVCFDIQRDVIRGHNGSHFFFRGMSTSTEEAIRGWEAVDMVWVEEAQRMSQRSREILYPTIRKPGSELWFTFNPRYRSDPVWRDFCTAGARLDEATIINVNYDRNPWFPAELEAERLICKRDEPDRYAHIWLGECDDEGEARKVLPWAIVRTCVDAWEKVEGKSGMLHVGLDIADGGIDQNALVARVGSAITHVDAWRGGPGSVGETVRRADAWCREHSAAVLYYDAGGLGVRSHFDELGARPYAIRPVLFGGALEGPDETYSRGVDNKDFFSRRNAQLAWVLRLRAQRTLRLMEGDAVDPESCLVIDPGIPCLETYMAQLSQPEWKENMSGKIVIEKSPDDAPSPDLYDATVLAYAHDSRYGVKHG